MTELHAAFLMQREEWMSEGACRGADPNIFVLDQGYTGAKAIEYCQRCTVRTECADYARRTRSVGIFGGKLFTFRQSQPEDLMSPITWLQDARPYTVIIKGSGERSSISGSPVQKGKPGILGR